MVWREKTNAKGKRKRNNIKEGCMLYNECGRISFVLFSSRSMDGVRREGEEGEGITPDSVKVVP